MYAIWQTMGLHEASNGNQLVSYLELFVER